jgi:hypothetical protein
MYLWDPAFTDLNKLGPSVILVYERLQDDTCATPTYPMPPVFDASFPNHNISTRRDR